MLSCARTEALKGKGRVSETEGVGCFHSHPKSAVKAVLYYYTLGLWRKKLRTEEVK
jgi:hypothetical protein